MKIEKPNRIIRKSFQYIITVISGAIVYYGIMQSSQFALIISIYVLISSVFVFWLINVMDGLPEIFG